MVQSRARGAEWDTKLAEGLQHVEAVARRWTHAPFVDGIKACTSVAETCSG